MDALSLFFPTLFGLIVDAIQLTIPLLIATMIGIFVFNFVQEKTKMKWIGSATLSLFAMFTILLIFFNTWNIWSGVTDTNIDQIPPDVRAQPEFTDTQANPIFLFLGALIQSILTGIILTLLALPAAFIGVTIFDTLKKIVKGVWPRLALTSFFGSLVFILLIAAFPWILVSLVYLAFFGL